MHIVEESPAQPVVLIPAYKPDERLTALVRQLRERAFAVLLVDDGGGEAFAPIFADCQALGAMVVRHAVNLGKGRALKSGINEILLRWPQTVGVVTADADGQHTSEDIGKIADALQVHPHTLIIGARAFSGEVPWKSRAGNAMTRVVYRLATGVRVYDTQTGLRGIPAEALPAMASLPGERYEYEMNMLLKLRDLALPALEVPITTVYIDDNKSSHFHPLRDGARIYLVIFRFMFSSIASFLVDYLLYLGCLHWLKLPVFISYAIARLCSAGFNYKLNKYTVFGGHGGKRAALRYFLLAAVQLGVGALLTKLLADRVGFNASLIKLPVDIVLFFISFIVQRDFVFKVKRQAQ